MMLNLARGLLNAGHSVQVLAIKARGGHLAEVPCDIALRRLGSDHALPALPALIRYLRAARPEVLLAAKHRAVRLAVLARRAAVVETRVVGRIGTHITASAAAGSPLARLARYAGARLWYPRLDRLIAVSEGVAQDLVRVARVPSERVTVVPNPVWMPDLQARARRSPAHPWLTTSEVPVIVGVGRLTVQKDFATLLEAFALLRAKRPSRLVILGEGRERSRLEARARTLGIASQLALPGFIADPYPYLARAALFVLSSQWEGSPNALTEALALGVPVVATDCPSGPREILGSGRYGPLVPPGDARALAAAMDATLDRPPEPDALRRAARPFMLEASTRAYLRALGLPPEGGGVCEQP